MGRTQEEFLKSSFCQVMAMIDMYTDEQMAKSAALNNKYYNSKYFTEPQPEVRIITSMKEIEGW